jgi:thiol-disulfide isomerase/thioredoxin
MSRANLLWSCVFAVLVEASAGVEGQQPRTLAELRERGAFEFPQREAKVLRDTADLRFSVWNNQDYLFMQAILWGDGDSSLGKTEDNREIGDWSQVLLDVDADGKPTPKTDRNYMLNPWPHLSGLRYSVCLGEGATTPIQGDSKGRGALRYLDLAENQRVRVDTYLVPLEEISRKVRDKVRLCYWGYSPKPALTVNSVGYDSGGKTYYGYSIPLSRYSDYVLGEGGEFDATKVPEGRSDISLSHRKNVKMPEVGQAGPEVSAKDWINAKAPLSLAELRGKVVLVEFWATWCGPCVEGIRHLNELQTRFAGKDFQLLSFVEEGHQTMDKFLKRTKVEYPIGLESSSLEDYGISGIPHAFVLDRTGQVVWHGHPAEDAMEQAIGAALKRK